MLITKYEFCMAIIAENPLILVDGSSYLYRAYYAPPHLTNSKGEATGAVYGVINMLRSLLKRYQPEQIAVVFDAKGKTFRNDMYSEYKAHRPPTPPDFKAQMECLKEALESFNIPMCECAGYEADDILGSLATQLQPDYDQILLFTGDHDSFQLIHDNVKVVVPKKGVSEFLNTLRYPPQ